MFSKGGLIVSQHDVYLDSSTQDAAVIRVRNPYFSKEACRRLPSRVPGLVVTSIPIPLPVGSNFRRVDCRQVQFAWNRPSREVGLIFETRQAALRLYRLFPEGFMVNGWRVTIQVPILLDNRPRPGTWLVRLTGFPESIEDQDISPLIPNPHGAFQVQTRYLTYTNDKETESIFLRSMLDDFGPLEQWTVSEMSDVGRIKAQALFVEESQARNAAAALHVKRLPFSNFRRLSAEVIMVVRFDVLPRVYNIVRDQIDDHKATWEDQHIYFAAFPPRGAYSTLELKGSNRKLMAKAKHELDLILYGKVMRQDGKNIWHPCFSNNGEAYEMLKAVEEELSIVIIRDAWLPQFRVFGAKGRQEQAEETLARLIQDIIPSPHFIRLDPENDLRWAVEGGLEELQSQLGPEKAVFDEPSRSILIHGSENDFAEAKLIMARGQGGPSKDRLTLERHCQICLWEAEESLVTSCNHAYCGNCFVDMCQAKAMNPRDSYITCEGDSGRCGHVFELSEIRNLLSSETFESVLEASFASFVQRHPEQYRHCPTPDCPHVYRAASQTGKHPATFTCSGCLSFICTACHAGHPSFTCAEHQGHASGDLQALERLKKKLGIQDCPRCGTSLERDGGCEHITCRGCKTHICWTCMATFDQGASCYQHLMTMHRGGEYD